MTSNTKSQLIKLLKDEDQKHVGTYVAYLNEIKSKDPVKSATAEKLADYFLKVKGMGLILDGKHVTIGWRGLSFDYIARMNQMMSVYPESMIDVDVVYQGDKFSLSKEDGKVHYKHLSLNAFPSYSQAEGAYCVIKNRRGEFVTRLSMDEIAKHKSKAKSKAIWNEWPKEMAMKTVLRKACKIHFEAIFAEMDEEDNKNVDLGSAEPTTDAPKALPTLTKKHKWFAGFVKALATDSQDIEDLRLHAVISDEVKDALVEASMKMREENEAKQEEKISA